MDDFNHYGTADDLLTALQKKERFKRALLYFVAAFFVILALAFLFRDRLPFLNSTVLLEQTKEVEEVPPVPEYLYLSGDLLSDDWGVNIYAFDLTTEEIVPITSGSGHYDFQFANDSFLLAFANVETDDPEIEPVAPIWIDLTAQESGIFPVPFGWYKEGLAIAEQLGLFAYHYRTEPLVDIDDENEPSGSWNVAIHKVATEENSVIPGARYPQFIDGGETILYLGPEGVYRWGNEEDSEPYLMLPLDASAFDFENMVLTANDAQHTFILTDVAHDTYHVYRYSNSYAVTDLYSITAEDSIFSSVAFSSDGSRYFVTREHATEAVAEDDVEETTVEDATSTLFVEERRTENGSLIETYPLPEFNTARFTVDMVLPELITRSNEE